MRRQLGAGGPWRRAAGRGLAALLLGATLFPCSGAGFAEAAESATEADDTPQESGNARPDPWEPYNRGMFRVNETLDIYLIAPVATGWRFVTPALFRRAVTNVNGLILTPVIGANDLLQLKFWNAFEDFNRFVFNASFGIAGLIDMATLLDIPKNDEDFGQTLGFWGVPPGPYFVIPLLGPSTVRDAFGRAVDAFGTYYFSLAPVWVTFLVRGVDLVNLRSRYLEEVAENRRESFDYYVFMRDAYLQNRQSKVERARGEDETAEEDLYYFEDEEYEEYEEEEAPGEGSASGVDEAAHHRETRDAA